MKRLLAVLLALLLLTGCAFSDGNEETTLSSGQTTASAVPNSLYAPGHALEAGSNGAVQVYPLARTNCTGMEAFGEKLLLFFEEGGTELAVFDPDMGCVTHSVKLNCTIQPGSGNVYIGTHGLAYYDEVEQSVVILDDQLRESDRVKLQEEIQGMPVVAEDLTSIYYCTENQLRVMDAKTGISRLLRQQEDKLLGTNVLCFGGTVVACAAADETGEYTAFVAVDTGLLLGAGENLEDLHTGTDTYFLRHADGPVEELLVGNLNGDLRRMKPLRADAQILPVLNIGGLITAALEENALVLDYYDVAAGKRLSETRLENVGQVYGLTEAAGENGIWLAVCDQGSEETLLLYWKHTAQPVADEQLYIGKRYTEQSPDEDGLAACQAQADAIGEAYGVNIRISQAALEVPCDYDMQAEYQVEVYEDKLPVLEQLLAMYPEEFFTKLGKLSDSQQIHICLVRQVSDAVTGVQYWYEGDAYIAIAMDGNMPHSFHNELYMVLDTYIFNNNSMLDQWEKLNPKGFAYMLDYAAAAAMTDETLISGDSRAFIDYASMSYPREDRAAIFAWAMGADAAECFQPKIMQDKLVRLCEAIRDAFRWEKDERTFPWEQYLEEPLAYTGKK